MHLIDFLFLINPEMNRMELVVDFKISLSSKDRDCWTKQQASFCYYREKTDALALKRQKL